MVVISQGIITIGTFRKLQNFKVSKDAPHNGPGEGKDCDKKAPEIPLLIELLVSLGIWCCITCARLEVPVKCAVQDFLSEEIAARVDAGGTA